MARVAGINVPDEKRVEVGLTYVYGMGLTRSKKLLKDLQIDPNTRVKAVS